MIIKEVWEVVFQIWIIHYSLNKAVVIFLSWGEQFHFAVQQFRIFFILYWFEVVEEGFDKVLGQIFCYSPLSLAFGFGMQWFFKDMNSFVEIIV